MSLEIKKIKTKTLEMAYLEKGQGPLLLCLHGFPDHAYSFVSQMDYFSNLGYRVVAPFMRGYSPTDTPKGSYQTAQLGLDVLALIEALGEEEAVLFGHDWGAATAYAASIIDPSKITKLITAAVPFGSQFQLAFVNNFEQQKRSWYMFFFQTALAEFSVANDNFLFIDKLWENWSPNYQAPKAYMDSLKQTLSSEGCLSSALEYYRQTFNSDKHDSNLESMQQKVGSGPINVPAIYLHGEQDGCIGMELCEGMSDFFTKGFELHLIENAGHFMHLERPDCINEIIKDFIGSV